jgi:hypothetical protein
LLASKEGYLDARCPRLTMLACGAHGERAGSTVNQAILRQARAGVKQALGLIPSCVLQRNRFWKKAIPILVELEPRSTGRAFGEGCFGRLWPIVVFQTRR